MARIRSVKPDFWTSEQVMRLSIPARLAFIGMWNFCDDAGNIPASNMGLKAKLFPSDPIETSTVQGWTGEMLREGLIAEYVAGDHAFWHVTGWRRHQRIEKPQPPKYPPFPNDSGNGTGGLPDDYGNDDGAFPPGEDRRGRDRRGEEGETPRAPRGTRLPLDWEPPAAIKTWADAERPDLDAGHTVAGFRDYWCAKPGRDGLKLDWDATYRNWVRKERAHANGHRDIAHTTVAGPKGPDPALQKIDADRLKAVPMPEAVRAKLAAIHQPRTTRHE